MTHLFDTHSDYAYDAPSWMHPSRVVRRTMTVVHRPWWFPFITITQTVTVPR